jgi:hypothetical protein
LGRRRTHVGQLTVALRGDSGDLGTLTAAGRLGDVGGLRLDDLRLLEAVAGHAAIGLHDGRLADRCAARPTRTGTRRCTTP